jgi:hypothetical protein
MNVSVISRIEGSFPCIKGILYKSFERIYIAVFLSEQELCKPTYIFVYIRHSSRGEE